jgi:hypothetical protein
MDTFNEMDLPKMTCEGKIIMNYLRALMYYSLHLQNRGWV